MQYLSARQMWHDAFYNRSANDQLLEINRANASLLRQKPVMNETQTRGPASNTGRICHMVMAGKVQHTIAQLPPHLQAFGHYCWAPKTAETLPHYKHVAQIAAALAERVKAEYPSIYGNQTSRISILIKCVLDYEYERGKSELKKVGGIVQRFSAAIAMDKPYVKTIWGDVIGFVQKEIRELQLEAEPDQNMFVAAAELTAEYARRQNIEITGNVAQMGVLALKEFAYRDQALLFSGNETREAIQRRKRFTQDYLAWSINVHSTRFKRDGWGDMFDGMISVCEDFAREALGKVVEEKSRECVQ